MSDQLRTIDEIVAQVMEHSFAVGDVLIPPQKIRQMMVQAAEQAIDAAMANQVQVIRLRPGDALVVHVEPDWVLTAIQKDNLYQLWQKVGERFGAAAVVISQGATGFSVIRQEGEDDGSL